jgi:hypothetical protein
MDADEKDPSASTGDPPWLNRFEAPPSSAGKDHPPNDRSNDRSQWNA